MKLQNGFRLYVYEGGTGNRIEVTDSEVYDSVYSAVAEQTIFWSDQRFEHFMMDFKVDDIWVSSFNISNELDRLNVLIYRG